MVSLGPVLLRPSLVTRSSSGTSYKRPAGKTKKPPKKCSEIQLKLNNHTQSSLICHDMLLDRRRKPFTLRLYHKFIISRANISNSFSTSCQLNQHLQDSLCQQLLQLDEVSIQSTPASVREGEAAEQEEEGDGDMEQQVDDPSPMLRSENTNT